jgi:phosphatidylinositol alpha-1,6-mannosyltransferase
MHKSNGSESVLGLFPRFGEEYRGGIQASAAVAWEAVARGRRAELLFYSRDEKNGSGNGNDSRLRTVLAALNKTSEPDLILIWQMGLIKLLPFLRYRSPRIVLFLHGIEAWRETDWLTRKLAAKVDLFLSNSNYTWKRFLSNNPQFAGSKQITVPLGIGESMAEATSGSSGPNALMLSRLSRAEDYKGHREVIGAWPLVLQRQPEAQLWIAGTGDLQNELEALVRERGLSSKVRFFGAVSETEKRTLLEQARCLLMPSRGEGFGLVYLEAMRAGRPCLVSNDDAAREVVSPPMAGLAVDLNRQDELAASINRLLANGDEWDCWSREGRRRYEETFTARHFQERLLTALFG